MLAGVVAGVGGEAEVEHEGDCAGPARADGVDDHGPVLVRQPAWQVRVGGEQLLGCMASLLAAAVLGDAGAVPEMLAADPAAAVAIDDERGWPPLLDACYSRWHQIDPGRAGGMAEVVRILLGAAASPDTNDGGRPVYRSP